MDDSKYKHIFQEMLRMSDDGFIVVDKNCIVIDINERYSSFLGKKRDDIIGRHIDETIPNSKMLEVIKLGYRDELSLHKYLPGYIKDEDNNCVLVSRSYVEDEHGEVIAGIAQVHFRHQAVEVARRLMREYNALEFYREEYENSAVKQYTFQNIVGNSPNFRDCMSQGIKASKTNFPVLLTGETGTGKEVFARAIHNTSNRTKKPMICINCAAIPAELLESELFGYEDGAFTGAKRGGKQGKFQQADGGTIFLDEIGDMPLAMQAKLLRVLQEHEIDPIGGHAPIPVDVRVISATRKDLQAMIAANEFREDLYYRLNVIRIEMIPLRDRREDIPELASYFLTRLNIEYQQSVICSDAVMNSLLHYDWPGNLRELDNVIKGAYATCDGFTIETTDLPAKFHADAILSKRRRVAAARKVPVFGNLTFPSSANDLPLKERLERLEYSVMLEAYASFNSVRKAAAYLGMSMPTFVRKKNLYAEIYEDEIPYSERIKNEAHNN